MRKKPPVKHAAAAQPPAQSPAQPPASDPPVDVAALVQAVLRDAYADATAELRLHAEKLRHFNLQKKALRDYLTQLRALRAEALRRAHEAGIDLRDPSRETRRALARLFAELTVRREPPDDATGLVWFELGLPDRVPPAGTVSFDQLDAELQRWEEALQTIGDDAQLANIDLQNALQRQQQTLQTISNLSKALHDAAMAVIRKIG